MNRPIYIERVGSLYYDGSADGYQPELKALVQEECRGRYRRIDRFTQLALLGAIRCAGDLSLPTNTLLYLASGKGPAGNNIDIQRVIVADREPPMPVQFINAVSNSVSFYIMQDLALTGQNLFVSRELHAFEAALTLVSVDLEAQRSATALLGMVDEITHPLADQCSRLEVPPDTALGEGSHWFLCHAERPANALGAIRDNRFFIGLPSFSSWLSELALPCEIFYAHGIDDHTKGICQERLATNRGQRVSTENLWDGLSAGAIADFLATGQSQWLLTISCDGNERFHAILVERF